MRVLKVNTKRIKITYGIESLKSTVINQINGGELDWVIPSDEEE